MSDRLGSGSEEQRLEELILRYKTAATQNLDPRTVMQEIFSRPSNAKKPVSEQEFAELRIDDWTDTWRPGFAVTEWRIHWSEADQKFMWEDEQTEIWGALQTAMNRYEARLRSLKQLGFLTSDMDF